MKPPIINKGPNELELEELVILNGIQIRLRFLIIILT
jgi:hypothetical protein